MTSSQQRGRLFALAVLAVLGILGIASAVASATPTNIPSWRSGGATLPWGVSESAGAESIAGLNLRYDSTSGPAVGVDCSTLSVTGRIENPGAGKAGTLVNSFNSAVGPTGAFQECQLVEFGEKSIVEGLECTIPKTATFESTPGVLTDEASPAGGLKLTAYLNFPVSCPSGYAFTYKFTLSGIGEELWSGQEMFSAKATKLEGYAGPVNGTTTTGQASFGLGLADSHGPVTVGQLAYEAPESTSGNHWYRGGAFRNMSEGLRTLLGAGAPTTLSGGAASLNLEFNSSGVNIVVTCNSGGVTGSVENPAGGGAGVANLTVGFTGCTVASPSGIGCIINGGAFTTKALPGTVKSASESWPIVKLGTEGSEIASFTMSGCSVGALNHIYRVKGPLFVQAQMKAAKTTGSWLIPIALNRNTTGFLTINGQSASASGELTVEAGGEVVTMG